MLNNVDGKGADEDNENSSEDKIKLLTHSCLEYYTKEELLLSLSGSLLYKEKLIISKCNKIIYPLEKRQSATRYKLCDSSGRKTPVDDTYMGDVNNKGYNEIKSRIKSLMSLRDDIGPYIEKYSKQSLSIIIESTGICKDVARVVYKYIH